MLTTDFLNNVWLDFVKKEMREDLERSGNEDDFFVYGAAKFKDAVGAALEAATRGDDAKVNHPAHYCVAGEAYEPVNVIEAWGLGFYLGNVLKYVLRAGRKEGADEVEDLKKARWYLDRKIRRAEASGARRPAPGAEPEDSAPGGKRQLGDKPSGLIVFPKTRPQKGRLR